MGAKILLKLIPVKGRFPLKGKHSPSYSSTRIELFRLRIVRCELSAKNCCSIGLRSVEFKVKFTVPKSAKNVKSVIPASALEKNNSKMNK